MVVPGESIVAMGIRQLLNEVYCYVSPTPSWD